jgi:hypothetical protein
LLSNHIGSPPLGHVVQFYKADVSLLTANVSRYIYDGLANEESAIIIATAEHAAAFKRGLAEAGCDVARAASDRRLLLLDAHQTLARFTTDRGPDWARFEATIQAAIDSLAPGAGLRAYGEMVGVLWQSGQFSAAIMLEDCWNRFLQSKGFSLFCSYPIDVFDSEFQACGVEALLCDHSHLLPSCNGDLDSAVNRAMDEHFGSMTQELRRRAQETSYPYWADMPAAEATILWLRAHVPEHADRIMQRAREHYQAARA